MIFFNLHMMNISEIDISFIQRIRLFGSLVSQYFFLALIITLLITSGSTLSSSMCSSYQDVRPSQMRIEGFAQITIFKRPLGNVLLMSLVYILLNQASPWYSSTSVFPLSIGSPTLFKATQFPLSSASAKHRFTMLAELKNKYSFL